MADKLLRGGLTETELGERYLRAAHRFARAADWREYLELAEEFRALDTYRDAAQLSVKCTKAASAPAYRATVDALNGQAVKTAADYREAARVMSFIQEYSDTRELMRVYTVKANALTYDEALALITNSEATTEELGRGVALLRQIKGFRNSRELLDRHEAYYFRRMYAEALALKQGGHVWSELEEAAAMFEAIAVYSDASEQAAACRRRAEQLKPKAKKRPQKHPDRRADGEAAQANPPPQDGKPQRASKKPRNADDETASGIAEVWQTIDKRRLVGCAVWLVLLVACLCASVWIGLTDNAWVAANANALRAATAVGGVLSAFMCVRTFLRMLTATMRRELGKAALALVKRMAAPLINAATLLLAGIGIRIGHRNRLGGQDERSFVYTEQETVKKRKKKLKNELKWADQPDNAARVRFIFIDYMIRRIREGYLMRHSMTPGEIGRELATEEDEQTLFRVYQLARYADRAANGDIPDATVEELLAINRADRERKRR